MNVSIETLTGLERRLTIAIDSDAFEEQITARLQSARGQVKIPGFRAGKVPIKKSGAVMAMQYEQKWPAK